MNKLILNPIRDGDLRPETWSSDPHPGELHYVDAGPRDAEGAPFLLLHGLGASLHYWSAIIPELSRDRRVVAVDLPGFGDSPSLPKPVTAESITIAIAGLMKSLGLKRPILVGHSLGAVLAVLLSQEVEAERVILLDGHLISAYELLRSPRNALRYPKLAIGLVFFLCGLAIPFRGSIARILARYRICRVILFNYIVAEPAQLDPDLLRAAFSKSSNRGIIAALTAARNIDVIQVMKATDAPTVVCWGDDDPLLLERDSLIAKRLLRPGFMYRIPDCGHWPMLERPAEVLSILKATADDSAAQGLRWSV